MKNNNVLTRYIHKWGWHVPRKSFVRSFTYGGLRIRRNVIKMIYMYLFPSWNVFPISNGRTQFYTFFGLLSLSPEIPSSLSISAMSRVLIPQLLATFFSQRLCTFILHAARKHKTSVLAGYYCSYPKDAASSVCLSTGRGSLFHDAIHPTSSWDRAVCLPLPSERTSQKDCPYPVTSSSNAWWKGRGGGGGGGGGDVTGWAYDLNTFLSC